MMVVVVDDKVARMLVGKWEEALTADSCVALHAVLGSHAQATAEYDDPPRTAFCFNHYHVFVSSVSALGVTG